MRSVDVTPPVPVASDRDWWVIAGMTVAAASAAVASFSGLRGLAEIAGWPGSLSWLLPVTVDAYAMTSARVWLAASTRSTAARRFARANAIGAIAASIAGNAAYHAVGAGLLSVSWPIVVLVGAVPAGVLGLTAHLHALRGRVDTASPVEDRPESGAEDRRTAGPVQGRTESPESGRRKSRTRRRSRNRTDAELWAEARAADERYRVAHGKPITRDALRTALRVSGLRATELRRRLHQEDGTVSVANEPEPAEREGGEEP